jgi:hypothetical protein
MAYYVEKAIMGYDDVTHRQILIVYFHLMKTNPKSFMTRDSGYDFIDRLGRDGWTEYRITYYDENNPIIAETYGDSESKVSTPVTSSSPGENTPIVEQNPIQLELYSDPSIPVDPMSVPALLQLVLNGAFKR